MTHHCHVCRFVHASKRGLQQTEGFGCYTWCYECVQQLNTGTAKKKIKRQRPFYNILFAWSLDKLCNSDLQTLQPGCLGIPQRKFEADVAVKV